MSQPTAPEMGHLFDVLTFDTHISAFSISKM